MRGEPLQGGGTNDVILSFEGELLLIEGVGEMSFGAFSIFESFLRVDKRGVCLPSVFHSGMPLIPGGIWKKDLLMGEKFLCSGGRS